jgi:hypothetical protein
MEIQFQGTSSQIQDYIRNEAKAEETEAAYQIKLLKMQQESDAIAGQVIEDTLEISQEALNRCRAEM